MGNGIFINVGYFWCTGSDGCNSLTSDVDMFLDLTQIFS